MDVPSEKKSYRRKYLIAMLILSAVVFLSYALILTNLYNLKDIVTAIDQARVSYLIWVLLASFLLFIMTIIAVVKFIFLPMEQTVIEREKNLIKRLQDIFNQREYDKDSLGRYQTLLEMSPICIVVLDVTQGAFIEANPTACKLFKLPREKLIGKSHIEMSPTHQPDGTPSIELAKHYVDEVLEKGNIRFEWMHHDSEGNPVPCIINLSDISSKEHPYVQGVLLDISDRKKLEEELMATNTLLQQANAAKLKFLAVISHELKAPLNAIMGFAEMLKNKIIGELNHEQAEYCHEIYRHGKQSLTRINDVLEFAKLESGAIKLTLKNTNIGELIDHCITQMKGYPGAADISFHVHLAEDLKPIQIDPNRFQEVLINLLSNAIKASPKQSTITVAAVIENSMLIIYIKDTGIGIAEDKLDIIFDPFEQAHSPDIDDESGCGLGLAIVKDIVELHHGTISVYSSKKMGTAFTIRIPYQ